MKSKRTYKTAFTLIELLVVIAIIALLLSILAPALSLAKEKGKALQCKFNLKGYHLVMSLYLGDNDSIFPYSRTTIVNGDPGGSVPALSPKSCQWHNAEINPELNPEYAGALWPYLETLKSSLCPTFKAFAKFSGHTSDSVDYDPQYSYSKNNYLGISRIRSDGTVLYYGVVREGEVARPSNVLLFVEETIWYITEGAPNDPLARWILNDTNFMARHWQDSLAYGDTIATYHKTSTAAPDYGMGNTVFIDGHVDYSDPWDTEIIGGHEYRRSYLLSYPKQGAKSIAIPY